MHRVRGDDGRAAEKPTRCTKAGADARALSAQPKGLPIVYSRGVRHAGADAAAHEMDRNNCEGHG